MVLVTNIDFPRLLAVSNFRSTQFSTELTYGTLAGLLANECKQVKSAEVYWEGDTSGICNVLNRNGIQPVESVNAIQAGMKILQVVSDEVSILINIKYMR